MAGPETQDVQSRQIGLAQIRIGDSAAHIATVTPVLTQANSVGALANTKFSATNEQYEFKSGFPMNVDGTVVTSTMAQYECAFYEHTPKNFALASGINPFANVPATASQVATSTTSGTVAGTIAANDTGGIEEAWKVVFDGVDSGTIYGNTVGAIHTFADLTTEMAPDNDGSPYFTLPANFFSGIWAANETFDFVTTAFQSGTAAYTNNYAGVINLGLGTVSDYFRVEAVVDFPGGLHQAVWVLPRVQSIGTFELDFQEAGEASLGIIFKSNKASGGVVGGHAAWDPAPLGKIHFITL